MLTLNSLSLVGQAPNQIGIKNCFEDDAEMFEGRLIVTNTHWRNLLQFSTFHFILMLNVWRVSLGSIQKTGCFCLLACLRNSWKLSEPGSYSGDYTNQLLEEVHMMRATNWNRNFVTCSNCVILYFSFDVDGTTVADLFSEQWPSEFSVWQHSHECGQMLVESFFSRCIKFIIKRWVFNRLMLLYMLCKYFWYCMVSGSILCLTLVVYG